MPVRFFGCFEKTMKKPMIFFAFNVFFNHTLTCVLCLQVSFDDVCYQSSVIERVKITELPDGTFKLGPKYVKQVRRLLREALKTEAGLVLSEGTEV